MQSLCTLRVHCRQWPRNTHYQAGATPYLDRTSTGWIAPACGWRTHSMTSSARAISVAGMLMPRALAVLMFTASSSLVGNPMGKSPGLGTFQNLIDVTGGAAIHFALIDSIARQTSDLNIRAF